MKRFGTHNTLGYLFFEVFLIVLGVLLGLVANEMRIEQKEKAATRRILEQIGREITYNRKLISRIAPHHREVRDSLMLLLDKPAARLQELPLTEIWRAMSGGFGIASLQQHAWDLARHLGTLEHMDFTLALKLSRLYSLQEFYLGKYDRLEDNFYLAVNIRPQSRQGLLTALSLLVNDLVIHEKDLLEAYGMMLELLAEEGLSSAADTAKTLLQSPGNEPTDTP